LSLLIPIGLTLASLVLVFFRLGDKLLADWDESVYAQIARQMVQTGDWLTTRWADQFFFDKPPLYMWAEGLLFQTFGVSELAARAPSALAGVGLVLVTFLIANTAYGRLTGILAALILLSTHGFLFYARFATLDIMLMFFSFLAIYGYGRARAGRQEWWYLVGAAIGLAFMTKSVAMFVPAGAIIIGLAFDRGLRVKTSLWTLLGAAVIFLALAVPWHLYMYLNYGQPFVASYVGQLIVGRALGEHIPNREDTWFYLSVLGADFYPWLYLLPIGLAFGLVDGWRRSSISLVLAAVAIITFGFYTLIRVKLNWYVIPIYPAGAILIAAFITNTLLPRRLTVALTALIALGATIFASVSVMVYDFLTVRVGYLLAVLAACCAAAFIWSRTRGRPLTASLLPFLAAFLLVASANAGRQAFLITPEPAAFLARVAARATVSRTQPLYILDHYPSVLLYSERPVSLLDNTTELASVVSRSKGGRIEAILQKRQAPDLASCCQVETVATSDELVYLVITPRASAGAEP
jgi:4-amino-4-deoxy-L-arabinose transferase-like glycosyltransferase